MPQEDQAQDDATQAAGNGADDLSWTDVNVDTAVEYGLPVIGAIVLLFVGWIVAGWVARIVTRTLTRAKLELTLSKFAGKMAKWAILLFVVLACLQMFGVSVTAFAAVLAAAGFAVGLAFQGTLSNFSAGVMLLVFRPFKVGDVVSVAGVTGKVNEIDLFVTTVDTADNRRIILPNGSVFGATIENISHHETRRVDVSVGTDYAADLDQTRQVLLDAAGAIDNVLADPEPAVVLSGLGGSSVDWSVRVWVAAGDYWPVKDALTREVKYALDRAGIGIPFPQMDVHVSKLPGE
ncbi:MAG: mechanosensitive ion channel family protein [Planctomycetota bacterium]|jgi:small conductance mechanosensitive channel